ncbi:DEAD/DEAH box helicase, partial [Lysinibacillus sp. NPDC056232]|uniref:DEAD/DEAH box helicase n=1 Tax=Lysinibacillus sp. NPDC056232 TaxID=3345756 RepID=UPI0035DBCA36
NVPHICLRVPTGGGKTLIAANAINVIAENLQKNKNNLVVWFVPSSAILTQTIDSLKNGNSIYREHLQKYYDSIEVLSVTEALNISKATLDNNLTIIVATFQSFRIEEPEGRKVYSSSGDLMEHFTDIHQSQKEKLLKIENGFISYSLSNVINLRRPIVIVDEAHNAKTDLSFEFLKNINASFILELTATPESKQYPLNVLYNVSAAELKSEKMLKIPMYVFTKVEWKELINDAISKRVELEKNAQDEDRYVRPIMLLQAQPDRKDNPDSLTVKVILDTLLNDFKIPRDHIAIQTSEIKELDNVDLLRSTCEIRYVITVTALKEGWDCPYAYVLCSLAELSSSVAVEQIIGRIIRQPNTEDFSQSNLNNSYAYIYSKNFIATLNNLKDAFVKNGFSQLEMDKLIKKGYTNKKQLQLDFKESESENSIIDSINIENGEVTVAFDSDSIGDLNSQLEKIRETLESKVAERIENDYGTDTSDLDTYTHTINLDTESTLEYNQVHIDDNVLSHQGKEDIETLDTEKTERHSIS